MIRTLPRPLADIGLLVVRLALAVVLFAHGWQKLMTNGWEATVAGFAGMGIPLAEAAATFAIVVELGGAALIALGAFTALAGVLVAVNMVGALIYAHAANGVFASEGGWELVAMIAAAGIALASAGAGRLSVDFAAAGSRSRGRSRSRRPRTA
ncbi:MAG: rane protein-like protein [Glaciihabitans sp.]|nr:rane protein-like protein [Glaciihabitans sp.]